MLKPYELPDRVVHPIVRGPFVAILILFLLGSSVSVFGTNHTRYSNNFLKIVGVLGFVFSAAVFVNLLPNAARLTLKRTCLTERRWFRDHHMTWTQMERPYLISQGFARPRLIECRLREDLRSQKWDWKNLIGYGQDMSVMPFAYDEPPKRLLETMVAFWQRAQADATALDPAASKD